jgi:sugar/nucleoside kinase (ribokinase family)
MNTPKPATDRLLCVGLTTVDVVALAVQLERFEGVRLMSAMQMAPAGTAAGAALVAARLGVATQLLGAVGGDAMGRFVCNELAFAGVDVSLMKVMPGKTTSATLIPIDPGGERMIYHAPGAAPFIEISPQDRAAAAQARAVHYAAVGAVMSDGDAGVELLRAAKQGGAMVTCDLIAPGPLAAAELKRILPYVDVFLPSAVEARYLTGEEDLQRAAQAFIAWGAAACVIKNGAEGALAVDSQGRVDHIAAIPVKALVDTTSCGDSFCAGFIAARLRRRPWLDALHFAAATASLVAQGPATVGRLESFEQVDALLEEGIA